MTGAAIVMKLVSSWLQFGFLFAPEVLTPDFKRLNPFSQAKQMLSAQSLMTLLTSLLKALLICVVLYRVIGPALGALVGLVFGFGVFYIGVLSGVVRKSCWSLMGHLHKEVWCLDGARQRMLQRLKVLSVLPEQPLPAYLHKIS